LYVPKKIKPLDVDVSVFGSHLDIMPTLYNISLSNSEYIAMGIDLMSDEAKNNNISIDIDIIMSKSGVVEYSFSGYDYRYYIWNKNKPREIILSSPERNCSDKMIKHYLSGIAISEYLIKNTGK
jgi:phosphoglycerol transferase MdoB-like AlkP superfamily enzyme